MQQGALRDTLLALIESRLALVRAWAYNGLGILAARDSSLRQEVRTLFDHAERSETAAVKVRIRYARDSLDTCVNPPHLTTMQGDASFPTGSPTTLLPKQS